MFQNVKIVYDPFLPLLNSLGIGGGGGHCSGCQYIYVTIESNRMHVHWRSAKCLADEKHH